MSTITPEQHLSLIRARCVELLEESGRSSMTKAKEYGSKEAGWRSTIIAIDDLSPHPLNPNDNGRPCLCSMCNKVGQIRAAWPLTLLQS